jgi:CheY-like chemotaxis protein
MVDDSAADRRLCRVLLGEQHGAGLEFIEARDAAHGLDLCRTGTPDCVLLDYKLPDMTGLQFLSHLTRDELAAAVVPTGLDLADSLVITHLAMHAELDALIVSGPRRGKQHERKQQDRYESANAPRGKNADCVHRGLLQDSMAGIILRGWIERPGTTMGARREQGAGARGVARWRNRDSGAGQSRAATVFPGASTVKRWA